MPDTWVVVPCYNEAQRLQSAAWLELTLTAPVHLMFVDDGSTDATAGCLRRLASTSPAGRVRVLSLAQNGGKGEAVRHGLCAALNAGARWLGFVDADLAVPVPEIRRLITERLPAAPAVLLGSRVRLMGRHVERNPWRHLSGRIFATCASGLLDLPIYDTQCGAKFFKDHKRLGAALLQPFTSRWTFDLELLARLLGQLPGGSMLPLRPHDIYEEPLLEWREVAGSHLGMGECMGVGGALARLWRAKRHHRRLSAPPR